MAEESLMFTKQLVFARMGKGLTLREKEFKAIALKKRFPGQSIVKKKPLDGILYPEIYKQYHVYQQY